MILTVDSTNLDFNIDYNNKIAISLSGGIDSTILLYCLAKELTETNSNVEIYPITSYKDGDDPDSFDGKQTTIDVLNYIKNIFPTLNWQDHIFYLNSYDMNTMRRGKADHISRGPVMKDNKIEAVYIGRVKPVLTDSVLETSAENDDVTEHMKKLKDKTDSDKTIIKEHDGYSYNVEFAFQNVTKEFVYKLYDQFNLNDLFDMTISCYTRQNPPCTTCLGCIHKFEVAGKY